MDEKTKKRIEQHIAGATVQHTSVFTSLESYKNTEAIDQAFISEWVNPFYMKLNKTDDEWIGQISQLIPKITDKEILKNLGDFNWRTRKTGAFFASVKNKKEFIDIIGTHLLKSEVCYAGGQYAVTLGYFNTKKAVNYLDTYLSYYLLHPELYFDQYSVISALKYTDQLNNTNLFSRHEDAWKAFLEKRHEVKTKEHNSLINSDMVSEESKELIAQFPVDPNVDYSIEIDIISKRIETIEKIVRSSK